MSAFCGALRLVAFVLVVQQILSMAANTISPLSHITIGHCVYCGATSYEEGSKRRLADEHIIPYGLNGEEVLREASCKACEQITGKMEAIWLRGSLLGCRTILNLKTRSPKDRPKALPLFDTAAKPERKLMIPIEDYPANLSLLKLGAPSLLVEEIHRDTIHVMPWVHFFPFDSELLNRKYGIVHIATPAIDWIAFTRSLAKIAHCAAISLKGESSFDPILCDFIRGREPPENWVRYVGGEWDDKPRVPTALHRYRIERYDDYMVVRLRLFAYLGAPEYLIVVGTYHTGPEEVTPPSMHNL